MDNTKRIIFEIQGAGGMLPHSCGEVVGGRASSPQLFKNLQTRSRTMQIHAPMPNNINFINKNNIHEQRWKHNFIFGVMVQMSKY